MSDGLPPGERPTGSTVIPGMEMAAAEDPNINMPTTNPGPSNPSDAAIAQVQNRQEAIPVDEFARIQQMEQNEIVQKRNYSEAQKNISNQTPALKLRDNPVRFNPPIIRFASGAQNIPSPKDRRLVFTDASQRERVIRKGFIVPDITHAQTDWYSGSMEGNDSVDISGGGNYPFEGAQTKMGALIYGFKFMYNPAVLDFGISSTDNVNLGYIASGRSTAMPIGATQTGSQISMSFPITRIDDISLIRSQTYSVRNEHYQRALDHWNENGRQGRQPGQSETVTSYVLENLKWAYGRRGAKQVTQEDLRQIMERGTMYDLEFLFRTVLGRRWRTIYRGWTADVGLAFGVPLKLVLSSSMVYRVRLTNISFSHKSFTPEMIPMYTDVALTFDRIPDVIGFK